MATRPALTTLGASLVQLASSLDEIGAAWALVGGLAVSARAEPRFTRDVDVAVAVASDAEAESLLWALHQIGYSVQAVLEQKKLRRLATARLVRRSRTAPPIMLDLLFSSSGIEREIVAAATRIAILPGVVLPVARVGHLIAMKLLARSRARPQDHADLMALVERATAAEIARARVALRHIEALGAQRGKRLGPALDRLLGG